MFYFSILNKNMSIPLKSECIYTSCYCEENVWHLAKNILVANKNVSNWKCYVVFVSNSNKCVPLWKQQCSEQEGGLVFWDYHVFLMINYQDTTQVLDLDTTLPFPVTFSQYFEEAIKDDPRYSKYGRYFRVIEAEKYIFTLSSDRRHMLNNNNEWLSPPPSYPPILNKDKQHNLSHFISMESSNEFGQVLNLAEFKIKFSSAVKQIAYGLQ
ncbi:protein N-terminal glutamine amidohydrolase [Adelges cooleyi]|uniref:protein N-terminal glutamine amidohydrolase n=1 Tax=Adelges cooleyi TaxID=133065 RepID=UPI0021802CE3|nr:protein N-terminal glutamine amidohydrolase [Adelges cooleyi]